MEHYQVEKFFYTRTKNVVPADRGVELFLYAALLIETNQPLGNVTRGKVKHVESELVEFPLDSAPALYRELVNGTVIYEISSETFGWLQETIKRDVQSFFLYQPATSK